MIICTSCSNKTDYLNLYCFFLLCGRCFFSAFVAQHPVQLRFRLRRIFKKNCVHAHCACPLQICLNIINKHTSGRIQLILFKQKPEESGIRLDHVDITGKQTSVHFRQKI